MDPYSYRGHYVNKVLSYKPQNRPGGIERSYIRETVEPISERGNEDYSDVVIGKQHAHPYENYDDQSVAKNANPSQNENASNRLAARTNLLDDRS